MRALDVADRPLAVLVDDHAEAVNENVAVMEVVRLPKVALMIEQLVGVLHLFESPLPLGIHVSRSSTIARGGTRPSGR